MWPQEALELIRVEYEVLPPVLDVRQAMRDDAPILLDDLRTDELGKEGDRPTNIASHIQHQRGDVEAGFAEAAVIVEREFTTAMVHQGYIEPQNATALYNPDGQMTIWTSTQGAFGVRVTDRGDPAHSRLARSASSRWKSAAGSAARTASTWSRWRCCSPKRAATGPVKLTMSRAEVLAATGPTSGSYIRVKMGADATDGSRPRRPTLPMKPALTPARRLNPA